MSSDFGTIAFEGERDYYTASLVAGRTYYIELVGTGGTPLPDPIVNLYRSGNSVAFDDDGGGGLNSRIVYTATQTGNFSVEVGGYADVHTGDYHLLVNEDDYKGTVDGDGSTFNIYGNGSVGAVNTGGSRSGAINYDGDADLFSASLIAGLSYTLEMRGSATGEGSLDDPYLYLLDEFGNFISQDDDGGTGFNSSIQFQAGTSGTHYLEAHSFANADTGDYAILVSAGLGSAGADNIVGLASRDSINGAGGNDTIQGGGNNDVLIGAAGNDTLRGQSGNDYLRGGAGADVLIGGAGNDRFDFDLTGESTPTVRDVIRAGDGASAFQGVGNTTADVIDLSTIDANVNVGGNQTFIVGGVGIGRVSVVNSGANSLVRANTDGDATFEFAVLIEDGGTLASDYRANDFIL